VDAFKPGTRVALKHDVDRYPHFIAAAGSVGTVVSTGDDRVFAVRLDEPLAGAEDWDNEVQWTDADDPAADLREVPSVEARNLSQQWSEQPSPVCDICGSLGESLADFDVTDDGLYCSNDCLLEGQRRAEAWSLETFTVTAVVKVRAADADAAMRYVQGVLEVGDDVDAVPGYAIEQVLAVHPEDLTAS